MLTGWAREEEPNVDELLVTSNFSGSPGRRPENIELFDLRREDRSPGIWIPGSKQCALLFA